MIITEFVKAVEGYYGTYRKGTKDVVLKYLREENLHPDRLHEIWRYLVKTVSGQYRFTPDVAAIEQAKRETGKEYALRQLEYKPPEPDPNAVDFQEELGAQLSKLVERYR